MAHQIQTTKKQKERNICTELKCQSIPLRYVVLFILVSCTIMSDECRAALADITTKAKHMYKRCYIFAIFYIL